MYLYDSSGERSSVIRGETIAVCEHSVNILCYTVPTVQDDLHEAGGEGSE